MTDPQAEREGVARAVVDTMHSDYTVIEGDDADQLVLDIAALLAATEAKVLEEVRARIIAEHRLGDRDEWLDVAAWCRQQAQERTP